MADIVVEVVLELLFQYPGAAFRWLFLRHRKSFKEILKEEGRNTFVTIAIILVILAIVSVEINTF